MRSEEYDVRYGAVSTIYLVATTIRTQFIYSNQYTSGNGSLEQGVHPVYAVLLSTSEGLSWFRIKESFCSLQALG